MREGKERLDKKRVSKCVCVCVSARKERGIG